MSREKNIFAHMKNRGADHLPYSTGWSAPHFSLFNNKISLVSIYCRVPKFLDARKLCCNFPKIQTKKPNLKVFRQKDANGIANSEDQSDLGLHCLPRHICPKS